ncbi:hypothetical protein [Streptomyces lavendulae]|uniref:hypothetical protein n=1 Tax=Streptomyces lavendulae TaxID=1914 RepID=UPI0018FFE187|nr:hypothetical protein [Streptomyces lavendulae]
MSALKEAGAEEAGAEEAGAEEAGAEEAVQQLLARQPATRTELTNPSDVAYLLSELKRSGAKEAVRQLSTRAAKEANLTGAFGVARLASALTETGAGDAGAKEARILLRRAMDAGVGDEDAIPPYGRETDGCAAAPWTWGELNNEQATATQPHRR